MEGLSEVGIVVFFKDVIIVNCWQDEVLFVENDVGKVIGYVCKGLLRVEIGGQIVVMLGEGDFFGEIVYILNIKCIVKIVFVSLDIEVVFFQEFVIDQLIEELDCIIIWCNLVKVLVQRVVVISKLFK